MIKKTLVLLLAALGISLQAQETKTYNDAQNIKVVLEQAAYYPQGEAALLMYFRDSIVYSQEAIAEKINGNVMVSFDVMPDSTLNDIVVFEGVGYGIDEEVVRLFQNLRYAPSLQNGVRLRMSLLVTIPVRARNKSIP